MVKGIECKTYEDWLKSFGLFNAEKKKLRGGLMVAPDKGSGRVGTDLFSLVTATELEGMAWSCTGGVRLGINKRFLTRV